MQPWARSEALAVGPKLTCSKARPRRWKEARNGFTSGCTLGAGSLKVLRSFCEHSYGLARGDSRSADTVDGGLATGFHKVNLLLLHVRGSRFTSAPLALHTVHASFRHPAGDILFSPRTFLSCSGPCRSSGQDVIRSIAFSPWEQQGPKDRLSFAWDRS